MTVSRTHLVLIPSYNSGPRLRVTVEAACAVWRPVWVVIDGSTDDSVAAVRDWATLVEGVRLIERSANGGKGAAVMTGLAEATAAGYTHALVMDGDGQHPAERIQDFMSISRAHPSALVLGRPVFGPEAPKIRLYGRQLSVGMVWLEILGRGIDDPLFGFRVYPAAPTLEILRAIRSGRRYDFDPELAVRLVWRGVPTINEPALCRYLARAEGGISHFHYVRDNLRMVWLHTRLLTELLFWRWPAILFRRLRSEKP